jgi:branched-chain amino acid aminotransferase
MNLFIAFKRDDGVTELVTPPLDGMILPGVTRDSVLILAREHIAGKKTLPGLTEKLVVSERPVTMREVKEASQSGRLVELFGTGGSLACDLPLSYSSAIHHRYGCRGQPCG